MSEQKLRNAPAVKPADPEKNGYDFAGWYLNDTQYAFDTNVTKNINLKAKWTPAAASTITTAAVENAKFNYQPGDAPQATAWVSEADTDKYEIAYECWQEFENNEPVAPGIQITAHTALCRPSRNLKAGKNMCIPLC